MTGIEFLDGAAELMADMDGLISIWEHPAPEESYFAGVDVAAGIESGDWLATEIIAGSDCRQVAEIHGHAGPSEWGRMTALLCWYYNEALLAVETHPGAFGIPCVEAARELGYTNVHMREIQDVLSKEITPKLGWSTDAKTHPRMMERVRVAVGTGTKIHSEPLLLELKSMRWERTSEVKKAGTTAMKAVTRRHDDLHDAYAIALCVRDSHYTTRREERTVEKVPTTLQDWAWQEAKDREARLKRRPTPHAGY